MNRIITLFALLIGVFGYSQVGIGTPEPSESAELEILSANKGILIPRIALKSIDDTTTIEKGNVNSLLIFNTTDEDDLKPGYYYWYENRWVRMINQSDDVLKTPWQIQNTENQATANTEHIYQQGKVAVGFTKDDETSNKQFEVKGDAKFLSEKKVGNVRFYNLLETNSYPTPEAGPYNFFMTSNKTSLLDNPDIAFGFMTDPMNGMISRLFTKYLETEIGIETNANNDGQFRLYTYKGVEGNSVNLEGGDHHGLHMSVDKREEGYTKVHLNAGDGVGFSFKENIHSGEGYVFPRNKGVKKQVLTVGDAINTAIDGNMNALVWKDVSDLVSQPWKIQATDSIASLNTQNIFQQGKVAVGFSKDDIVSEKQLEVKGDIKALNQLASGFYNWVESGINTSSVGIDPEKAAINIFGTFKDHSLSGIASQTTNGTGLITEITKEDNVHGNINSFSSGLKSIAGDGSYLSEIFSNVIENGQSEPIVGVTLQTVNLEKEENSAISLTPSKISLENHYAGQKGASVHIEGKKGITFGYDGSMNYTFPTQTGNANQVLTVKDAISNTDLVWKNVSDLVSQPWRIQGTDSIALQNTQNIYQMGSVAVGVNSIPSFTIGTETINPKLHVAGDISTTGKFWTTNSVYADYVFEKYFNGESAIKNDYEFMTLDYIKEFVKTNKHLPGVTPIKDLKKSESGYSFNITGLTVELLEKTEELFLHTIEQQQQIDELKSQVEENNRRLKMLEKLFLNNSK